jgi:Putative zinc-finger
MNHPAHEQWMSYLYDELDSNERADLEAHLQTCPDCEANVGEWQSARRNLDAWRLPHIHRPRNGFAQPVFKWAAAAAVFLLAGFSVGRLTSASADVEKVRAVLEPQMQQELVKMLHQELDKTASATLAASGEQTKALLANYATAFETKRAEDNDAIFSALDKLDSQRIADYLLLKKDVDTVAVNADAGLRSAEQQLIQLADYTPPVGNPNSQPK